MKLFLIIIAAIILYYFVNNNFNRYPFKYVGYFYPNIDNMELWIESKPMNSIEECRYWAEDMADNYDTVYNNNYDYECGKDCYEGDPYNQGNTYTCYTSTD